MNRYWVVEAAAIVARLCDLLAAATAGGRAGAELRLLLGRLKANARTRITDGSLGATLAECFELVREARPSVAAFDPIRAALLAETPSGLTGKFVVHLGVRNCLIQQSLIIAATEFDSRQAVDAMQARMNVVFGEAEEAAADQEEAEVYRLLVSLHAAVTRHLQTTARPLPRVVPYRFAQRMPVLSIAQRIHSDASREGELRAENRAIHPLFMPAEGRALSA